MYDCLYYSKKFRTLNIIDEETGKYLAIEVDTSLSVDRVIRVLDRLQTKKGLPKQIRVDNGPELISANLLNCYENNPTLLCHIQLGKLQQNGFIEQFNSSFRHECLNAYLFRTLIEVRDLTWFCFKIITKTGHIKI